MIINVNMFESIAYCKTGACHGPYFIMNELMVFTEHYGLAHVLGVYFLILLCITLLGRWRDWNIHKKREHL